MAYNKTTWNTGDTITAEKLNHAEQGIANALETFNIHIEWDDTSSDYVPDKTFNEIDSAMKSGIPCAVYNTGTFFGFLADDQSSSYNVIVPIYIGEGSITFDCYNFSSSGMTYSRQVVSTQ